MRRDVQSAGDSRPCFAFLPIAHALFLARENPLVRSFVRFSLPFSLFFLLRVARSFTPLLDRRFAQEKRDMDAMKRVVVVVARRSRGFR